MINVAVIGVGYWGPNLVRNLSANQSFRVRTICDLNVARADVIRQHYCANADVVGDVASVMADRTIDAVVIATPIRSHYELALAALKAGKHVLVEKPLARTEAECDELIEAAAARKRVLMVGHVFEYSRAVVRIKDYLMSGEIGRVLYIQGQRVNLGRIQTDLSALWSFAPHDVSIVNYWLDAEPVAVSARGFSFLNRMVEDVVFMTLEYPNEVAVNLSLSWLDPRKTRLMTIVGDRKMIIYDDVSLDAKVSIHDKGVENLDEFLAAPDSFAEFQFKIRSGDVLIPSMKYGEPLAEQCAHFAHCVETQARPRTDGENGRRVVRALRAAQKSLENKGRRILLDELREADPGQPLLKWKEAVA